MNKSNQERKACPLKFCGQKSYARDAWCEKENCAWWMSFDDSCALACIAGILADSTICQNSWPSPIPPKEDI